MEGSSKGCVELFAKVAKGQPWEYQRQFFPSKLGGLPAWLEPDPLPPESAFSCGNCSAVMTFVLQLYAPDDDEPTGDAFHRALFLFACQPCKTQWRAFRSQLPRKNRHYAFHPEAEGTLFPQPDAHMSRQCCMACGIPSSDIQHGTAPVPLKFKVQNVSDDTVWRKLHPRCEIAIKYETLEATFEEFLLHISEGEIQHPVNYLEREHELHRRYQELKEKGQVEELDESEEEAIESIQKERLVVDHSFDRFCKRTTPEDVLYYCRDGKPLWISDKTVPLRCASGGESHATEGIVPPCEICGGPRSFEFQVLPQMLFYLKGANLDFASVVVYTCASSCNLDGKYQEEYIYVEKDHSLAPK
ncbi:putative programmed cell death protein 2 [Babesia divergens]|uniref:Programmed cell death protein 2 n=1 Tax=Babesia divergens TaxID=32595 RepID=A0AAD9GCM2_BABDI|nr:putative programmed cell death protein 2 [Babesia divergens]